MTSKHEVMCPDMAASGINLDKWGINRGTGVKEERNHAYLLSYVFEEGTSWQQIWIRHFLR